MAERIDSLHISGYRIIQDDKSFCYGIDAVLLSNFALKSIDTALKKQEQAGRIFDLGTGNAIIPILLSAQASHPLDITALEYQEKSADRARRSVGLNTFLPLTCIEVVQGDIKNIPQMFDSGVADFVVSNPPYMKTSCGRQSPNMENMIARQEIFCNLNDVVLGASHLLKEGGKFFMIHRPERLNEIFDSLKTHRFKSVCWRLVCPFKGDSPTMVLISAECGKTEVFELEKTQATDLVIYERKDGRTREYTAEVKKIYLRD